MFQNALPLNFAQYDTNVKHLNQLITLILECVILQFCIQISW